MLLKQQQVVIRKRTSFFHKLMKTDDNRLKSLRIPTHSSPSLWSVWINYFGSMMGVAASLSPNSAVSPVGISIMSTSEVVVFSPTKSTAHFPAAGHHHQNNQEQYGGSGGGMGRQNWFYLNLVRSLRASPRKRTATASSKNMNIRYGWITRVDLGKFQTKSPILTHESPVSPRFIAPFANQSYPLKSPTLETSNTDTPPLITPMLSKFPMECQKYDVLFDPVIQSAHLIRHWFEYRVPVSLLCSTLTQPSWMSISRGSIEFIKSYEATTRARIQATKCDDGAVFETALLDSNSDVILRENQWFYSAVALEEWMRQLHHWTDTNFLQSFFYQPSIDGDHHQRATWKLNQFHCRIHSLMPALHDPIVSRLGDWSHTRFFPKHAHPLVLLVLMMDFLSHSISDADTFVQIVEYWTGGDRACRMGESIVLYAVQIGTHWFIKCTATHDSTPLVALHAQTAQK